MTRLFLDLPNPFGRGPLLLAALVYLSAPRIASANDDPVLDEASALYDEGEARYQTSDYAGAVRSFTEAFQMAAQIADPEFRDGARTRLLFNLARAHMGAYTVDGDPAHLRQAKELLLRYIESEEGLSDEEEARELLARAESELEVNGEAVPAPPPTVAAENLRPTPTLTPDAVPLDAPKRSRLITTGSIVASLAAPALGIMVAGIVRVRSAEQDYHQGPAAADREAAVVRGKTGSAMIVAGSVSAGVLLGSGVAILLTGKRRSRATSNLNPLLGPTVVGASYTARF